LFEARGIRKTFPGGRTVLDGVSFALNSGEIAGLSGESGNGKTTLARILCGTVIPDAGQVSLDGTPLYGEDGYNRRAGRGIQLVFQQPFESLDPRQRVINAVAEPLLSGAGSAGKTQAFDKAEALLRDAGLEPGIFRRYPSQLSGGQAQRVVIARALTVSPRVLIADEATAMLDTLAQARIVELFRRLSSEQGIAVLFISHDRALIRAAAGCEYALNGGVLLRIW
jgi:peptide/nickel transport system ATP-binding protein